MKRKVYRVQVTCDGCGKEVMHEQVQYIGAELPDGWGRSQVHGCGMTDYTRTDELCPDCLAKRRAKQRTP